MKFRIMIVAALAAVAGCGSAPSPQSQGKAPAQADAQSGTLPLTLENIHTVSRGVRGTTISPDGAWMAVTGTGPDGNGIYLCGTGAVAGGNGAAAKPEPCTQWVDGNAPSWFPDSQSIVFSKEGDLWRVARGSKDAKRLTTDKDDERAAIVSPDGSTVAFYSGRSGFQDIWLVDANGGASKALTSKAMALDDPRFAPAWSPDSKQIAYISNAAEYWRDDVWLIDVASGKSRQLSKGLMASSYPVWSPDGKTIALLGTSRNEYWYEDLAYIYLIDPATGAERTVKMQVYATDWLHSQRVFWSPDSKNLFFVYQQRGEFDIWTVATSGGVATRVSNIGGSLRSFEAAANGSGFSFVRATATRGAEAEYLPATGGTSRVLTKFSPAWAGVREPEEVSYRSFDGLYIQGFLYRPPDFDETKKYPALVQVHGGGTNSYLRGENLLEQYLAQRGYVVLAINYRGGSGFGREFQDLSVNDWATGQAHDAAMAADFVRAQPWSNSKVGIYGYSYGGIMTMATIARYPGKYDAAVPMAGIYDFGDALENADRLGKIFTKTGHGGDPKDRQAIYDRSNTLARVKDVTTPLLIMHGEADVRAPYRQYQLAVETLKKGGKTFESKSYPNEPHGFRNPKNRIDMYQRLEAFFAKTLGGGTGGKS